MKKNLFFLLVLIPVWLTAQVPFSIEPFLAVAEKTTNYDFLYNYVEIINPTTDTLQIEWHKLTGTGHGTGNHDPAPEWVTAINDPSNVFNPADSVQSAVFSLAPSGAINEKFIYQLFPHEAEGELYQRFSFKVVGQPADSVVAIFSYRVIKADPTSVVAELPASSILVAPNPATDYFSITNLSGQNLEARLIDVRGITIQKFFLVEKTSLRVNSAEFVPGLYLLELQNEQVKSVQKIIIGPQ